MKRFFTPAFNRRPDLRVYIIRTAAVCTAIALCVDIANQLLFFESWAVALRSWLVTVLVSGSISIVAARVYGLAQLRLFEAKADLERLSLTDPLTGLLNRRALTGIGSKTVQVLSLIIVDIDRFKHVNDTHGHRAGDDVIVAVSRVMQQHLGPYGDIARLGGEEFACLSRDIAPEMLIQKLESFRDLVSRTPVIVAGGAVTVTISAGIAATVDGKTFESLYSLADRALYRAKSAGRNQVALDEGLERIAAAVLAADCDLDVRGIAA